MARPRKKGNKDLPKGLYRNRHGIFMVRHPVTGKWASLRTRDPKAAREIYESVRAEWEKDLERQRADEVAQALRGLSGGPTVVEYARRFREERLPQLVGRGGKPLADKTRSDYAQMLRDSVEPAQSLAVPLTDASPRLVRQFLQRWLDSPAYYNYLRAILSRMFQEAVDEGLIDKNHVREVARRQAPKRDTYITDDDYRAICAQLTEWQARAVDLLYLLSQRPGDVLGLRPARDIDWQGYTDPDTGETWPLITFTAAKTRQPMEVVMNEALIETVSWFQDWKKRQGLVSPYLICHPKGSPKYGKRVEVDYLSRAFRQAVKDAGLGAGAYTLRDVRPKSLTDEWIAAGDSDKGGHQTEQMKRYYRRIALPMRARTNVTNLRGSG